MNKKLIAPLSIGLFTFPFCPLAQAQNVTVYGTFNVDFERVEAKDPTADGSSNSITRFTSTAATSPELDPRNRVSSNSSNIGFRGVEDLGGGLKAIFQCESAAGIDSGTSGFCSRNSNVGLNGPWGTAFYGQWDTPHKLVGIMGDPTYATGIAGESLYSSPGYGIIGTTLSGTPGAFGGSGVLGAASNAAFSRRQGDSVQYWSPKWGGLSFRIAYSANEAKSSDPPGAAPGVIAPVELDPYIWSASATFERGPLVVAASYERHIDWFGLNSITPNAAAPAANNDSSRDQGIRASIGYRFGNTTVNVLWDRHEYENDGGPAAIAGFPTVEQYERDIWYVSLLHRIGAWTLRGFYATGDDADCDLVTGADCDADETGVDAFAIGASYTLSKRTDVYLFFIQVDNDDLQAYTFGVQPLRPAGAFGYKNQGVSLGIRHSF